MDGNPLTTQKRSPPLSRRISRSPAIPCEEVSRPRCHLDLILPIEHPSLCSRGRSTPQPISPLLDRSRGSHLGLISRDQYDQRSTPKANPPHFSEPRSWTTPPASATSWSPMTPSIDAMRRCGRTSSNDAPSRRSPRNSVTPMTPCASWSTSSGPGVARVHLPFFRHPPPRTSRPSPHPHAPNARRGRPRMLEPEARTAAA
jgi:hypothetical protein